MCGSQLPHRFPALPLCSLLLCSPPSDVPFPSGSLPLPPSSHPSALLPLQCQEPLWHTNPEQVLLASEGPVGPMPGLLAAFPGGPLPGLLLPIFTATGAREAGGLTAEPGDRGPPMGPRSCALRPSHRNHQTVSGEGAELRSPLWVSISSGGGPSGRTHRCHAAATCGTPHRAKPCALLRRRTQLRGQYNLGVALFARAVRLASHSSARDGSGESAAGLGSGTGEAGLGAGVGGQGGSGRGR